MQQTLFIVILAVAIAFVLAYRWKKKAENKMDNICLLYTSPSPRDGLLSRMPSSA